MRSLNIVIVDDEYLAVQVLREYAVRSGLTVLASFTDPTEALQFLQNNSIDLLLLDIQMPFLTGFELLQTLGVKPMVIFTTARHDYAVRAYELDVLDYLVKPIPFERFEKAMKKVFDYAEYKNVLEIRKDARFEFLMIRADHRIVKIMIPTIKYVEGWSEYVKIHTSDKTHITLGALRDFTLQLPPDRFARIHKSYIISLDHVSSFTHQNVKLKDGKELPLGRAYKQEVLKKLNLPGMR